MRTPIVMNLIFEFIAIFASLFALGFWIFVINNKEKTGKIQINTSKYNAPVKMDKNEKFEEFFTSSNLPMNTKENPVTIHKNQQIKQMIDMSPIKLDHFGLIPMNNAKDIERKESQLPMAMAENDKKMGHR